MCTEGMNPFAKEKVTYSIWPINLCLLNFPHRFRITTGSMLLAGILPGRNEPKNLDPYLQLLVEELESINGSEIYDSHRCEQFQLKASITQCILDYPGQNKVFHCQVKYTIVTCSYSCVRKFKTSYLQKWNR